MNARRCQGCAAPLPDAQGGEVRCTFCGLVHDAKSTGTPRIDLRQGAVTPDTARRTARWITILVVAIVLISLVPAGIGLYAGWRAVKTALPAMPLETAPSSSWSTARGDRPFVPADLRSAAAGVHVLEAAPPPGGFGALDAVGTLPWTLTIAQAWSTDARLERVDVNRLRPDGTVNVQDDGEVRYRFVSPGKRAALLEHGRLTASAQGPVSLFVTVERGIVRGQVIESRASSLRKDAAPPHPSVVALTALLERPAVRTLLEGIPFLNAYLINSEGEGWTWYFSTLAGESKPRVRARDGAVWPYARAR